MTEIVYRQALEPERAPALAVLYWVPGVDRGQLTQHAQGLADKAQAGDMDMSGLFVAVASDEVVGAALALPSAGRTSLVLPPRTTQDDVDAGRLLGGCLDLTRRVGMVWAQALIEPNALQDRRLLDVHGFEYLTDLLYMQRPASAPCCEVAAPAGLTWQTYSPHTHAVFASVIEQTYTQTRDCPRLNGLRPMDDVIAGHKAEGVFDPRSWLLAVEDDRAVACVLLNPVPETHSLELTYMGVVPEARGQSLGKVLCAKAIEVAGALGVRHVTLAVDCRNGPARSIYQAMGFRAVTRRSAFLLKL